MIVNLQSDHKTIRTSKFHSLLPFPTVYNEGRTGGKFVPFNVLLFTKKPKRIKEFNHKSALVKLSFLEPPNLQEANETWQHQKFKLIGFCFSFFFEFFQKKSINRIVIIESMMKWILHLNKQKRTRCIPLERRPYGVSLITQDIPAYSIE